MAIYNPCRYCTPETGRSATCHATCERYANYEIDMKVFKEKVREQKAVENFFIARNSDIKRRMEKKPPKYKARKQ